MLKSETEREKRKNTHRRRRSQVIEYIVGAVILIWVIQKVATAM
ncbi:hypothetical protein OCH239_05480 [Roseivivax halodurans JCM 10272]|uniref:Uncharacterized protein n=1 Tax=Roseivivax halodurans JCM 10272 TaxID=1449350 RepID=X7EG53_9RHOB|nr:hypothetical protein OCH239_05480 [Roseivivax halodurans JCM 10272]